MSRIFFFFSAMTYLCSVSGICVILSRQKTKCYHKEPQIQSRKGKTSSAETSDVSIHPKSNFFLNPSPVPNTIFIGIICCLAGFLFIPAGSFPAYVNTEYTAPIWITLFVFARIAAYAADAEGIKRLSRVNTKYPTVFLLRTIVEPSFFLAMLYGLCASYMVEYGFPGNIFHMESFICMPILAAESPVRAAGISILAAAAAVYCVSVPDVLFRSSYTSADSAPPAQNLLGAFLRFSMCAFAVELFFPVPASRYSALSAAWASIIDFTLYWSITLALAFMPTIALPAPRRLCLLSVAVGAVLCFI